MGQQKDGVNQHKAMAMGRAVTGMKKGGAVKDRDHDGMKKGGMVGRCMKCGGKVHSGKC